MLVSMHLIVAGLGLLWSVPTQAQRTYDSLAVGVQARAMMVIPERGRIQGLVVDRTSSRLTLRTRDGEIQLSVESILRLDVRSSRRYGGKLAALFGASGAAAGLVSFPVVASLACSFRDCGPLWDEAALLVGIGAGMGVVMGVGAMLVLNATRPWYPVDLPRAELRFLEWHF
jgi:hypothetical protein